jgi:hypothetical protein
VIQPTGVAGFDSAVRSAELVHQNALAVPGLTQAAATLADKILLQTIIAAGVTFSVTTTNPSTGLAIINNQPGPPT